MADIELLVVKQNGGTRAGMAVGLRHSRGDVILIRRAGFSWARKEDPAQQGTKFYIITITGTADENAARIVRFLTPIDDAEGRTQIRKERYLDLAALPSRKINDLNSTGKASITDAVFALITRTRSL